MNSKFINAIKKTRPILWSLFLILVLTSLKNYHASLDNSTHFKWIKFKWDSSISNGKLIAKSSMVVPVTVNGYYKNMYMQFDLGSNVTILYEKSIQSYLKSNENIRDLLKKKINGNKSDADISNGKLKPQNLIFDRTYRLIDTDVYLFLNYGETIPKDTFNKRPINYVGTIGAEICKNKILIIDYPKHRMCFIDTLPPKVYRRVSFTNGKIVNGRMHIPYTIADKTRWVLFDSGASLTYIMTDKRHLNGLVNPNNPVDSIIGNSSGTANYVLLFKARC